MVEDGVIKIDLIDADGPAYGQQVIRIEHPDDPEQYVMVQRSVVVLPSGAVFEAPAGMEWPDGPHGEPVEPRTPMRQLRG